VNNAQTGYLCAAKQCLPSETHDCGLFRCNQNLCLTTCVTHSDCVESAYCQSGVCISKLANGGECTDGAQCTSNICQDSVCCNAPCEGVCEACDDQGLCLPINGSPRPGHGACPAGTAQNPCEAAACDGADRTHCLAYAGASVACRSPSCENGEATLAAGCDGLGACPALVRVSCGVYACGADACRAKCQSSSDCATGASCDVANGQCVPGASCDGPHTRVKISGEREDCAPYVCRSGLCTTVCNGPSDCVEGRVCDDSRHCVPSAGGAADEGGCGCRLGSRGTPNAGWLSALLLGFGAGLRRRRTIRSLD
jgi:hypothetical protein